MRDLRTTLGMGLTSSLFILLSLGFFARSSHDIKLVFFGFACGLVTAFMLERLTLRNSQRRGVPSATVAPIASAPWSLPIWPRRPGHKPAEQPLDLTKAERPAPGSTEARESAVR